jgi:hypothetical protein
MRIGRRAESVVICPERSNEDWPPKNFLTKQSSAELRRCCGQSVNRVFALTLTNVGQCSCVR